MSGVASNVTEEAGTATSLPIQSSKPPDTIFRVLCRSSAPPLVLAFTSAEASFLPMLSVPCQSSPLALCNRRSVPLPLSRTLPFALCPLSFALPLLSLALL
jgi:hypothetical protein